MKQRSPLPGVVLPGFVLLGINKQGSAAVCTMPNVAHLGHRYDYANKAALDLFEAKWEEVVGQPSYATTENVEQARMYPCLEPVTKSLCAAIY